MSESTFLNKMQNDMVLVEAAYILYLYWIPKGEETLKEMGITEPNVKQKVSQKRTKFELRTAKAEFEQKKRSKVDYYDLLATASKQVGYRIPNDVLLIEWIGILKAIKKENEFKDRQARSSNRRGAKGVS